MNYFKFGQAGVGVIESDMLLIRLNGGWKIVYFFYVDACKFSQPKNRNRGMIMTIR